MRFKKNHFRFGHHKFENPIRLLCRLSLPVDPVERDVLITLPCPIYRWSPRLIRAGKSWKWEYGDPHMVPGAWCLCLEWFARQPHVRSLGLGLFLKILRNNLADSSPIMQMFSNINSSISPLDHFHTNVLWIRLPKRTNRVTPYFPFHILYIHTYIEKKSS